MRLFNLLPLLVLSLVLGQSFTAVAQPDAGSQVRQPHLSGQATMAGPRFYRPGTWGMVGATLVNPTEEPAELFISSWVKPVTNMQFGRRVWIPPRARVRITHPIYVTPGALHGNLGGEIETLVLDERRGGESREDRGSNLLLFNTNRPSTSHLSDPNDDVPGMAVVAARLSRELGPTTSPMRPEDIPSDAAMLEVVDVLIISRPYLPLDDAQIAAIRDWVQRGGRLWLMMDRVDPMLGHRLLRDDWQMEFVEDATLNRIALTAAEAVGQDPATFPMRLHVADDGAYTLNGTRIADALELSRALQDRLGELVGQDEIHPGRRVELTLSPKVTAASVAMVQDVLATSGARIASTVRVMDEPVRHRRVIASNMRTMYSIDGWPAMMHLPVGRGDVFITTVEPKALLAGKLGALPPLGELASSLLVERPADLVPPPRFANYLGGQIGFEIAARSTVAGLLIGFVVVMVLAAGLLFHQQKLEWLSVVGIVGAVVVSVILVVLGTASRQSQPLTVASAGVIEVMPGQHQASYTGMMSVYSPDSGPMVLSSQSGGTARPDLTGDEGRLVRMIWSERDSWQWNGLELRSGGIRNATIRTGMPFADTPSAVFTFNEQGLVGRLERGGMAGLESQFIVNQMLHARAIATRAGDVTSRPEDLLASADFAIGALQDTATAARQEVVEELVNSNRLSTRPHLIGWADAADTGIGLDVNAEQRGTSLVVLPITLTPPPVNADITVPAVVVPLEPARPPGGGARRSIFGIGAMVWPGDVSDAGIFVLRFKVPEVVQPMAVEGATLSLEIRAPSQVLIVSGYDADHRRVEIRRMDSPSGRVSIDISNPELLRIDEQGGVVLAIQIRPPATATASAPPSWRIESMGLTLRGKARVSP